MFYLKINRVRIKNTDTPMLFPHSKGPVIDMLSIASTDVTGGLDVESWLSETDANKRTQLHAAVGQAAVVPIMSTQLIYNTNASIVFGDTGYVVFNHQDIPENINWIFLAIKSNERRRQLWGSVQQELSEQRSDKLIEQAITAFSLNPAAAFGLAVCGLLARIIVKKLAAEPDEILGMSSQSFIRVRDYPYGERTRDGVPDTSGNMLLDYSLFGFNENSIQR